MARQSALGPSSTTLKTKNWSRPKEIYIWERLGEAAARED
jgi:hypothetical protein